MTSQDTSMFPFASAFQQPAGSPIRELFQYLSRPGMISFAGGYPAASTFDTAAIGQCMAEALAGHPAECLQYGATEGVPALREALSRQMGQAGAPTPAERILVTSGSQQGFDFLVRAFVEPGVPVIVEAPTYPAAIQALRLAGARLVPVPADAEGIDTDALEQCLRDCAPAERPRLIYLVPTFANPTGATLSVRRRQAVLRLAAQYELLVIEDDPYGCLAFDGAPPATLLAMANGEPALRDRIVYLGSLSKTVAPGLRIGWMAAHPDVVRRAVLAKQASDLCTPPWIQRAMAAYLDAGHLSGQVARIIEVYRDKRDAMVSALERELGGRIDYMRPGGGMFVWASLPDGTDSAELLREAIEENVLFVPGKAFHAATGQPSPALRLSFATPSVAEIGEGVRRLARALVRV
ncbi:PLP-dependent aminotransferase family protein [Cupriavidus gilardii]|uniref:PLP-dependent aminotransferase family protein n=2 Tax=Cupriavidus gilardii TaxID=82541 RepID=A0ABY4VLQ5_9BURK|nr:PLP-dependent aminotransferase family protein [Cupriavidus gilardii]USE78151.1 PLP-dependent aminotransferase family protein [Cupriavidus gilardii]